MSLWSLEMTSSKLCVLVLEEACYIYTSVGLQLSRLSFWFPVPLPMARSGPR